MKNQTTLIIIAAVLIAASFYGGMKYGQSSTSQNSLVQSGFQGRQGGVSGTGTARRGTGQNGGFTGGQIISKDDKSITVAVASGGSKIVFVSGTTPVMKLVAGSLADLTVGEQVTINGSANADGSITAQLVQIRPALSTRPF